MYIQKTNKVSATSSATEKVYGIWSDITQKDMV